MVGTIDESPRDTNFSRRRRAPQRSRGAARYRAAPQVAREPSEGEGALCHARSWLERLASPRAGAPTASLAPVGPLVTATQGTDWPSRDSEAAGAPGKAKSRQSQRTVPPPRRRGRLAEKKVAAAPLRPALPTRVAAGAAGGDGGSDGARPRPHPRPSRAPWRSAPPTPCRCPNPRRALRSGGGRAREPRGTPR